MQKYYTAVGRFERKGRMGDMTCPMVIINNREYALDIQEMILWAALNWQIMDAGALEDAYSAKLKASGIRPQRSISDCMRRLMQRGLVVEGCGETDEDALYALLSGLYVVPISDSLLLRLISFIKLTVFGHVPFAVTRKLFRKDRRSANERRVYRLSRQALLSTAELIKCVEYDIHTIHSDSQLMDALYADDTTTSDNIADMVRPFVCCHDGQAQDSTAASEKKAAPHRVGRGGFLPCRAGSHFLFPRYRYSSAQRHPRHRTCF